MADMAIARCTARFAMLLAVAVCALFAAVPVMAQTSAPEFRKFLTDKAAFADQDLEILDKGEIVIKMLPVADKQEIAVFGIDRLLLEL